MEQLSQKLGGFKTDNPAAEVLAAIASEKPTSPPVWGAAAARYIGEHKGGLTPNQLYKVVCISMDGTQITIKNSYGKEQTADINLFLKPHEKRA